MKIRFVKLSLLFALLFSGQTLIAQTELSRDDKWRQDLKFLATELAQKHKNLFFQLKREDFERDVARIEKSIPTLTDAEVKIELIRLVASVGDGHTQVWWLRDDFNIYPISLYRFSDGWYVVRASEDYKQAVGSRLVKIGDTEIERAVEIIKTLVACDNESCYKDRLPRYLYIAEFLHRLNILPSVNQGQFVFEDANGKRFALNIKSFPSKELQNPKLVSAFDEAKTATPLYRKHPELFYWREYLAESESLYIAYRNCREMESLPFNKFAAETLAFIDANSVRRVIIDLRQNGGGKESIIRSLVNGFREREKLKKEGNVFVVIGRGTYSSANNNALELKEKIKAILIGEPSGQKPNHYGEVKTLKLPNSGLEIGYSSNYFKRVDGNPAAIMPDISVTLSFADYMAGRDPVLNAILQYRSK